MAISILQEISEAERQIETSREQAEKKAQEMMAKATLESKRKIDEVKQEIVQKQITQAQSIRKDLDAQRQKMLKKAEQQAQKLEESASVMRKEAAQYVYDEFLNQL